MTPRLNKIKKQLLLLPFVLVLAGCAGLYEQSTPQSNAQAPLVPEDATPQHQLPPEPEARQAGLSEAQNSKPAEARIFPGSGRFIDTTPRPAAAGPSGEGSITLNFENTDIREVIKVILNDQLGLGYVIDPAVQGGVTFQTGRPLRLEDLLPTLEMLLRMRGAAMIDDHGLYRIVPMQGVLNGNLSAQLGDSTAPLPDGYSVRVVPLQYIAAAEMSNILKPMVSEGSVVRTDSLRNLLILAGSAGELSSMLETIRVFDVDWMSGLSVGFFPLAHASSEQVAEQVRTIIGSEEGGPVQGLIKVLPMQSANGLLVVTPQKEYLHKIQLWIERFDRLEVLGDGGAGQQFHVYKIKNGQAAELSELLGQLFGDRPAAEKTTGAAIAPGQKAVSLSSERKTGAQSAAAGSSVGTLSLASPGPDSGATPVRVVADETRNLLLVNASPQQYAKIERVLQQVDITPLQVLIEARIIEVTLQGDLKYGLQWFFKGEGINGTSGRGSLDGTLDSAASAGLGGIFPGFNYSLVSTAGQVRALFSALAEDTSVKVLSSPSVMVLDNHAARIQVGDQVPIATQQQQATGTDSTIINSITYRDTGIVLEVKPRVTPGGLVTLDVEQEVSDVSATKSSTLDSPTISTRKITSSIAVQNGHAIIMGGLIRDRDENGSGGVPGLHNLPLVGWMFGQTSRVNNRTELVVMLVPRVIGNSADATRLVEDYRLKLKGLEGEF